MILEANNITKAYGSTKIIKGVSICVDEGECIGIAGKNGCGKSTLLSVIAGIMKPDSGNIKIYGGAGYLPQINPLIMDMSVSDNLKLWSKSRDNYKSALTRFDLDSIKNKRVSKLSGGMARRLAIACMMVNSPRLLIMDEPTAALDIEYKEIIHKEMKRHLSEGGGILLVTHEKEELSLCNKYYMMKDGVL